MRVLLPLDQRLQSEDKEETVPENIGFIATSGDDELERKPSPVYYPIVSDTIITIPESFSVGDSHTSLSKLVGFAAKTERRPRKRSRGLNPLQHTSVPVERDSPILESFCFSDISNNNSSNLQHVITLTKTDSKPTATLNPESNSNKLHSTTTRGADKANPSVMAGGRRRYDSDDENTVDQCSDPFRSKTNGGRHNKQKGNMVLMTPAENEPPTYNYRALSSQNQSIVVSTSKENLSEIRDTNPASSILDYTLVLKKMGLELVEQEGDGNCLFRAVSLQVYGHAEHHAEVRERCMDFIASNAEHYSDFVAADSDEQSSEESFAGYIARKRRNGVHGNHTEIQALSELYNRPVEVYTPDSLQHVDNDISNEFVFKPINIFQTDYKSSDYPIRLSYHDGNHYNAIIDPLVPTAGLGLGLPGLQPGLADKMQVAAAVTASDQIADRIELDRILKESTVEHRKKSAEDENDDLQRAMKESTYSMDILEEKKAIAMSDLDATNFELEQEMLAYSWDTYSRKEQGRKQRAAPENVAMAPATSTSYGHPGSIVPTPYLPAFSERPSSVAAAAVPETGTTDTVGAVSSSVASRSSPAVASVASSIGSNESSHFRVETTIETDYPPSVQELVVNGFDLKRVIRAYELVGENFDDMLNFLISTSGS